MSRVIHCCQVCKSTDLRSVFFAGYLPPVNGMPKVGERPHEQVTYPAELLRCGRCSLVQLGFVVDPELLFPPDYPYTSGTTRVLRENFAELAREANGIVDLAPTDFVVDIGSNDGTLLSNFKCRRLGVEPTDAYKLAEKFGIESIAEFFDRDLGLEICSTYGRAKLVTAANVFAHIDGVHEVVRGVCEMLADDGVFVSESHYLAALFDDVQYDTIYHEHLRYYSLASLQFLLEMHELEVFHACRIPTHGGSIRIYASRSGKYEVRRSVQEMLESETDHVSLKAALQFKRRASDSKLDLYQILRNAKAVGMRIYGVGAPSRASTLVNYVGLDESIVDCVLEIAGSSKIGKCVPGTLIPVVDEALLDEDPPDVLLLLSWHLADELIPKMRARFTGRFVVPLPNARIV